MGIQEQEEVVLIRHAYVLTDYRNRNHSEKLLGDLTYKQGKPILIGTWKEHNMGNCLLSQEWLSVSDRGRKGTIAQKILEHS